MKKFNEHVLDTKEFWNQKIRQWEIGRYQNSNFGGLLEKIANYSSSSLRQRLRLSAFILRNHIKSKTIVEVGCGSALMAGWLIDNGAKNYIGYDIAEAAIENGKKLYQNSKYGSQIKLICKPIMEMNSLKKCDVIFSLGLLDWLKDEELDKLFNIGKDAHYLHAISEKRFATTQFLHRAYVHFSYGFRTNGYVPRYFTVEEIKSIVNLMNTKNMNIYRDRRLSFGALLSSLPLPSKINLAEIPFFGSS